jgi:hypothetical protein
VSGDILDQDFLFLDHIDYPVLVSEPRRSMSSPFSVKAFVMESLDEPQTCRPGDSHDVFPFFIPLEELLREAVKPLCGLPMLVHHPHTSLRLDYIRFVSAIGWGDMLNDMTRS